ncbi:TPA: hypothetical protein I8374_002379 [Serratia marcescens]|jgi:hypothetical protein|nr:EpsG family protein [Serratia marcescens]MBH2667304.1 EpsG family protein [Serratia marcescens]MBH2672292.1 EpsG family protein [Serratia marcescens]MBH3056712.1 EpsG family protein [Serratia marcescens]MBH3202256.1 EpsG family protein [Serratia marcescens]MBH3301586.1 EpsG family protein [Serratia marcescens]
MREYKYGPVDSGYRYNNFILITAIFLWLVFTISPFISYYLSLIVLAMSPEVKNLTRRLLGVLIVLSGTVYIGSRNFNGALGDDITFVYYPVYRRIFYGADYFSSYSGGWEFVLGGLFKLLALFTEKPVEKDIFTSVFVFLPYIIYYIWLEKFGLEHISKNKKNLCAASALGIMGLLALSVQIRQGLATSILLLAIGYLSRSKIKSTFFTALAIFTHLTSIPIYFIIRIFSGSKTGPKVIGLGFIVLLVISFQFLVGAIVAQNLLGVASFKFQYYLDKDTTINLLAFFFSLMIMIAAGSFYFDKNENLKKWRSFILWGGAAYILLLPIPMASDRLFMVMSVFLMGYLLFLSFSQISTIYRMLLILYFIYKFMSVGPLSGGLGGATGYEFWTNYDWIGDYPFYFWIK